ncbi:hypothetical protein KFE94_11705 [bacterium SCSIO 12643]|nr:hypothetical protein KFE94_11705 [bacterium SCSIO 12643]
MKFIYSFFVILTIWSGFGESHSQNHQEEDSIKKEIVALEKRLIQLPVDSVLDTHAAYVSIFESTKMAKVKPSGKSSRKAQMQFSRSSSDTVRIQDITNVYKIIPDHIIRSKDESFNNLMSHQLFEIPVNHIVGFNHDYLIIRRRYLTSTTNSLITRPPYLVEKYTYYKRIIQ